MHVYHDQNSQDGSVEEHKAQATGLGDKMLNSVRYEGYKGKMSDAGLQAWAHSQSINPEGRPSSTQEYEFAYQKSAKNSLDERSEESPSDVVRKYPTQYYKQQHKKPAYATSDRPTDYAHRQDAGAQKSHHPCYNELYDLGQALEKERTPYDFAPFHRSKQFHHQPLQGYSSAYSQQYQSESDSDYLAHMQAGYLEK
jgi:hypothetical protein